MAKNQIWENMELDSIAISMKIICTRVAILNHEFVHEELDEIW
jgi:hypothetical protein